jgi:hypothetical protein
MGAFYLDPNLIRGNQPLSSVVKAGHYRAACQRLRTDLTGFYLSIRHDGRADTPSAPLGVRSQARVEPGARAGCAELATSGGPATACAPRQNR